MSAALLPFDRDITLSELLQMIPRGKLESALANTIGHRWWIVDATGMPLVGQGPVVPDAGLALPLRLDFEVIGRLLAVDVPMDRLQAAALWLEMVLAGSYRYRMAADLHLEAVNADHEALQRQHATLQESEARYRELAAELEQRVKAQVEVIERTQRQLYQTEKMAAIGSLAAGMAHEINNPIGFIKSNLNTASLYVDKMCKALAASRTGDLAKADSIWRSLDMDFVMEDFPGLLTESITGADRISRIVTNLKAYANVDSLSSDSIDLNEAVRAATGIIRDQLPPNVALELDLQPLPAIAGDQSRINQALFALVQNACHALSPNGGLIHVATRMHKDEICIIVNDNGCGIRQDIVSRIFDPFFTTRDVGKGTGLGLTISRDIVSSHGGRIEVQTAEGAGSTFTVHLPVAHCQGPTKDVA